MAIRVIGSAVLSSSKDLPSSNWVTTTSCFPPDRVLIIPASTDLQWPVEPGLLHVRIPLRPGIDV